MIDFLIGGFILIAVVFAVRIIVKNRKSGCGFGCTKCSSSHKCNIHEAFDVGTKEKKLKE